MTDYIEIGKRRIGQGSRAYCIAELSANHNQDFSQAVRIIEAAKDAGADAVKLQTYTADTITLRSDKECFRIAGGTLWDGRSLHDLYQEAFTPWEWQPKLKEIADELGMQLFSSAFDDSAVDFLEQMNVPAHKVASFELVDIGLIQKMARTGKPLIMSTGMASVDEISEAVEAARGAGATQIALLKCTSAYPAPPEEANLLTIPELARRFSCPVGLSDHTMGIFVCNGRMEGRTARSHSNPRNSRRWWRRCAQPRKLSARSSLPPDRARPTAASFGGRCLWSKI
jgi:N-acetylneuraminate synthase